MKLLKEYIIEHGVVLSEHALDVSLFLNEQVDVPLMQAIGKNFAEYYKEYDFDGFITVESSGIAPSVFASLYANKPLVVLKKRPVLLESDKFIQQECTSFTKQNSYFLTTQVKLVANKRLILLDDFLAEGNVVISTEILLNKVNSTLVSTGIAISKDFQQGYQKLKSLNKSLYRLVGIKKLTPSTNKIDFSD
ncbi:MAG: phosphoribosyltransferase family protein [Culicoidibacterales bacterium]